MRVHESKAPLTLRLIAGTYVVLLGIDIEPSARPGLLGFAVRRRDVTEDEERFLENFLLFEVNDSGEDPDHSSENNPFQAFLWGDYRAKPNHTYRYEVIAMYGEPGSLERGASIELEVETEDLAVGKHEIFFNRGAATSQAYVEKFGRNAPDKLPNRDAYEWLSRGLDEALVGFIAQAQGAGWGLRGALYEFSYWRVLRALLEADGRGADVKLVVAGPLTKQGFPYHPGCENAAAIEETTIKNPAADKPKNLHLHNNVVARQRPKISHNKFLVLLRDDQPIEVWTGSTNITSGGVFGQSNVGHIVRDESVALAYLDYYKQLEKDPEVDDLAAWTVTTSDLPEQRMAALADDPDADPLPPPDSTSVLFSPRKELTALQWYAALMDKAESSVFLTAAFGVSEQLRGVFNKPKPYLRYLLLDNRNGRVETVARDIEDDANNRVAAGAYFGDSKDSGGWHQWLTEYLPAGLNHWVKFIHTKYMLIDPLGPDPVVVTGSANFSEASTVENDENMLVIRGDTRVADVYLGEFMRLFTHFRLRGLAKAAPEEAGPGLGLSDDAETLYLTPDDSWSERFFVDGSPEAKERQLFAGSA